MPHVLEYKGAGASVCDAVCHGTSAEHCAECGGRSLSDEDAIGATENARLENPAPTRRDGKRRNKLYGQPMGQFLQFIEITVSLIL